MSSDEQATDHLHWRGYRVAAWGGVLIFGTATALAALRGDWLSAVVLIGFAIPTIMFLRIDSRLPALVDLLVVVAALLNAVGYAWDLYESFALFDKIVHGYTLFALTLPLGLLAQGPYLRVDSHRGVWFVFIVASFGISLGALWEIAEWLYDLAVPSNAIKGKTDTITDLIVDSIGAVLAGWLSLRMVHRTRIQRSGVLEAAHNASKEVS